MTTILVCNKCGGDNIQILAWVDANTNRYVSEYGLTNDDRWCNDCEEHVRFDLTDTENYIAEGK